MDVILEAMTKKKKNRQMGAKKLNTKTSNKIKKKQLIRIDFFSTTKKCKWPASKWGKVLNTTNHQGDANQNHNEIPFHEC